MSELTIHRITDTTGTAYSYAEQLLVDSFPPEEYRPLEEWRRYTREKFYFYNMQICRGGHPVALLTYWQLDGFIYVEHLAVHPSVRGGGIGSQILSHLIRLYPSQPIVLEVELPTDNTTRRRIEFYRRNCFCLLPDCYLQPPYRPSDTPIPMNLMAYTTDTLPYFSHICSEIYREVYSIHSLL